MANERDLDRLLREKLSQVQRLAERKLISGYRNNAGDIVLRDSASPQGTFYARTVQDSRDKVVIYGDCSVVNVPFVAEYDGNGNLVYKYQDTEIADLQTQGTATTIFAPPAIPNLSQINVGDYQFAPLRVNFDTSGGLSVAVGAGWHVNDYFASGTIDLTSNVPATPGEVRWVVVGIDTTTNALTAINGTPITGTQQDLVIADIADIAIPTGVMPLGAVALENGQTAITQGTSWIVDIRRHHDLGSGGGIDFAGLTLKTPPAFADEILINDAGVDKRTTLASTLDLFDTRSSPILLPGRRFKEKIVTSTGTVNNLDPENATVILLNNSSALTITGLAAGQPGQIIYLRSVGSANVFLEHQNTGSSASNRLINIVTSAASPLVAGKGHASYIYDGNSSRWRMLDHFQGGVIAFDMTWTSSGTAPTLGNGTKTSDYEIQRNMCFIQFTIVMGSTTTYGTGTWLFVMPINRVGGSTRNLVGQGADASAGLIRQLMNTWNSAVNIALAPDSAANIGPTVPWTWATSDTIAISGWYRIA